MRPGYLAIILHAHLPFIRHPEHEKFLEETWLFEAVTECYLPLLEVIEGWRREGLPARLTLSLSPTLCSMLRDPLLQERCRRHLGDLVDLAEKEVMRTQWDTPRQELARFYAGRFQALLRRYEEARGDLVSAFARLEQAGLLQIITCAATHAVLPLLLQHPESLRAQLRVACDSHRACFGNDPAGFWLPECAYAPGVETHLAEAGLRWFVLDTHGLMHARPRPRCGVFAPVLTPAGVAAFGRDPACARQVWSRQEGYPGEPAYRDFYRDIGFDLDLPYLRPHLPTADARTYTGIKYHRITGGRQDKALYDRAQALRAVETHAEHFLQARLEQIVRLSACLEQPPLLVAPYDAELFGHWWYEGPAFLDRFVRRALTATHALRLVTPGDYLDRHPRHMVAVPDASSWGEGGHLKVWLNQKNAWIYPLLREAQRRMMELARRHTRVTGLVQRALRQAARELLLAQASDWPFILSTGTSPEYAGGRLNTHLTRFRALAGQVDSGEVDQAELLRLEKQDNLFPEINPGYWA